MRRLIKLGTSTYIAADTIVHISEAKKNNDVEAEVRGVMQHDCCRVYDCTGGKELNTVVITESNRMYLTNHTLATLTARIFGSDKSGNGENEAPQEQLKI